MPKPEYPPPAAPRRVQLSQKRGFKMPANTMKADNGTEFRNPFRLGDEHPVLGKLETPEQVQEAYELYVTDWLANKLPAKRPESLTRLKGRNLACWCGMNELCHVDVLLERLNPKPAKKKP